MTIQYSSTVGFVNFAFHKNLLKVLVCKDLDLIYLNLNLNFY